MTERNIRLLLGYDGTDFCGWQRQDGDRTVQGVLEEALQIMHKHHVTTHAAGRTDSGVHAAGQVVNFLSDIPGIPAERYAPALNTLLPRDVRVMESREADKGFHARFSAKAREYRYYIYPGIPCPAHLSRYCWAVRRLPDLRRLNTFAGELPGDQNFAAFAAAGDTSRSTVRTVDTAAFFIQGPYIVFRIRANAFLMRMVRSVVGTVIGLERNGAEAGALKALIGTRDRKRVGETAPPWGLFLHEVNYDE